MYCPGGGIGRHKGLKIPRLNGRPGSSPGPGTIFNIYKSMIYEKLRRQSGFDFRGDAFLGKDWESSGGQLHFCNKTMNSSHTQLKSI